MKTIIQFDRQKYLEENGLICLTGEACNYSMRLLFDVQPHGKELLQEFFSLPDISLMANWNGHGAIGSIMLCSSILSELIVFCLLWRGKFAKVCLVETGEIFAFGDTDEDQFAQVEKFYSVTRVFRPMNHPSQGSRNTHTMSGRNK